MNEVQTMKDLEMFVKNNQEDLIVYYQQIKKQGLSIDFPKLFNENKDKDDRLRKKRLIEIIVMFYLDCGKSFENFEKDCSVVIGQ